MATNFDNNAIATGGGIKPSTKDTPTRIGERIETLSEITNIPNPYVGMIIYVIDEGRRYEVQSIKEVQQGLSKVSKVDQFRELPYASKEYVHEAIANSQLNGGSVDLEGYAKIENIPTKVSELENDSNFISAVPDEYVTETELNEKKYATQSYVASEITKAQLGGGDNGNISLDGFATEDYVDTKIQEFATGVTQELADYAKTTDIPTNVSQLTNDNDYATKTFVDNAVGNVPTHEHSNKSILDTITQEDIDKWNSSQGSDGVANLDTLTLEVINNELNLKDGEDVLSSVELPTNGSVELQENSISMNELGNDLKHIKGKNLLDPAKFMIGTLNVSNGSYSYDERYITTDFIEIDTNKTYYICRGALITIHGVAFYDAKKQFISYASNLKPATPESACYLRLRITSANVNISTVEIMIYEYEGEELMYVPFEGYEINSEYLPIVTLDKFEGINEDGKIKDEIIEWKVYTKEDFTFIDDVKTYENTIVERRSLNMIDPRIIIFGNISHTNGAFNEATNICTTSDYVEIKPDTEYMTNVPTYGVIWYDETKEFISYVSMPYASPALSPKNAKYMRPRLNPSYKDTFMWYEYTGEKIEFQPYDLYQLKTDLFSDIMLTYVKDYLQTNGYLNDTALAGLKWYVMGDSISCSGDEGYQGYVSARLGLNRVDKARMGNHMTYNNEDADRWGVLHELRTFDMNDADIITILIGTNDWANYELGELSKDNVIETTFFGAMNVACKYLVEHWIGKRIGFMTPPKRDIRTFSDEMKQKFESLIDGMIKICSWYSIPILNLWVEGGLASDNDIVKAELIEDGLHPNTKGHAVLARPIEQFLKRL